MKKLNNFKNSLQDNQVGVRFSVDLSTDETRMLEAIQKKHNISTKSQVIRGLIKNYYETYFK
jgi:metal-responsive CopG/Arc/MetJ family transcriptional regulator